MQPMTRSNTIKVSGFTLLELLVTIVIGVFISLAATTFLAQTARSYNNQDMTARIQENARFAVQAMSYDIRQAGFFGCSLISPDNFTAIEGEDNSATSEPDRLTVRYARADLGAYDVNNPIAGDGLPPTANTQSLDLYIAGTGEPVVDLSTVFEPGDEILVSDCYKSEIATVQTAAGNTLELTEGLKNNYLMVTQVYFASDFTYEIEPRTDTSPPVLFRVTTLRDGTQQREPLVQGIEFMRVLYGVADATTDATVAEEYIPWDDSLLDTEARRIVSMKVALMARSVSNHRRSEDGEYGMKEYAFTDDTVTLLDLDFDDMGLSREDRVSRRVFVNTLQIRNRL